MIPTISQVFYDIFKIYSVWNIWAPEINLKYSIFLREYICYNLSELLVHGDRVRVIVLCIVPDHGINTFQ